MWVNKELFQRILDDNKAQSDRLTSWQNTCHVLQTQHDDALAQKSKDDITIDWMRHRINALEHQNAVLMHKATGMPFAVPEIVPTRPGTLSVPPELHSMPDFEDVGSERAAEMGIIHDEAGYVEYKK